MCCDKRGEAFKLICDSFGPCVNGLAAISGANDQQTRLPRHADDVFYVHVFPLARMAVAHCLAPLAIP
jgi:hypothetical protein